jgi:biopolymer transport protein ExbD
MSATFGATGGGRGSESQDFELNLASIIDCFTVLIAFMLASTAFLAIGIMDAGVAAAGSTSTNTTPPAVNITVEIAKDHTLAIKVTGKVTETIPVAAAKDQAIDFNAMSTQLAALKTKWADVQAVTVLGENTVEYQDIVQTMDAARKTLPVVLLGGF